VSARQILPGCLSSGGEVTAEHTHRDVVMANTANKGSFAQPYNNTHHSPVHALGVSVEQEIGQAFRYRRPEGAAARQVPLRSE
jgi:hypothetical protein